MNPVSWYLDTIASWGLLPTPYITEYTVSGGIVVGGFLGIICIAMAIAGLIAFFCDSDFAYEFEDNLFMLIGYRMTAFILSVVAIITAGALGLCLGATVFGLFALAPWITLGGLVALGPLLFGVGLAKRYAQKRRSRSKSKASATVAATSTAAEPFELGDDFHEVDYEGEKIIMPK